MATLIKGETFRAQVKANAKAVVVCKFAGPEQHSVNATNIGETFTILADTISWKTGNYIWEVWASVEEIKSVIMRQHLTLHPSADEIGVAETGIRTDARKAVENIRAVLSGGATLEAKRYKINNRELERHSIPELLQLLSYWEKKLQYEERKEKGISLLGPRIEFYV